MSNQPFTDIEILNALDCCMERPNRKCRSCPLFNPDNIDKCDNLEWYAYQIIEKQRREIERLKANDSARLS